jgi:DNA-directed RNA polymerase specialized sigma24 family protein
MVDAEITILHPTLPAIHAETCEFRVGVLIAGQFVGVYALQDFTRMLEEQIPRLRRYAHALCRDRTAADDLVQDCLCRALTKGHLFQPGTDLRAWLFTMMHHQHVNGVRSSVRRGASVSVEDVEPMLTEPPVSGRRAHIA